MDAMNSLPANFLEQSTGLVDLPSVRVPLRANVVVVVEDTPDVSHQMAPICDYLGLTVMPISSSADLGMALDEHRPLAVVAMFETEHQDGCYMLAEIARRDRDLSVMMITNHNASYLGAAEAAVEMFRLTAVRKPVGAPTLGELAEFLARARRRGWQRRATSGGAGKSRK